MISWLKILGLGLSLCLPITLANANQAGPPPLVVTSIKPIHSLVAAVMGDVGEPGLILQGAESPHNFNLRPSQARRLQSADIVFWIGHDLEVFLAKPISLLGAKAIVIAFNELDGISQRPLRESGLFEDLHEDEHDHNHGQSDPHIWLDPENAKRMVTAIKDALAQADPLRAKLYQSNAHATLQRLEALSGYIKKQLSAVSQTPYIVFHDAYSHFEDRFGLTPLGSLTLTPDLAPSAKRIAEIQDKITELKAGCLFAEPQFSTKLVSLITASTSAKAGFLDPLGASFENGPNLYFDLLHQMTASFTTCLN